MEKLGAADPQRIGAYRLLGRLGAGGMGHVYLARSDRGRTVAVKLVREDLAAQEEFRARFRQEVQAARQVGGYWTAPVLDADTEAAVPWVATGYVAGPSLQQVVGRDHGALPERSVRILAAGLAHALQDIHAAGIVHRDLKPSNVLVTIDGPRVIDFGIARALETQAGDGLTRTGSLVGSPGFMAPEQVRGDRITPACDIFCLGSVLAYAATGTLPFGSANSGVHALMFRIAQDEPDLTGIPEGIAELVRDCLRKDPGARPTLDQILDRTGAEDTVSSGRSHDPWLPNALVAQLGRHAVRLLDTEDPQTAELERVEPVRLEKNTPVARALQTRAAEPPAAAPQAAEPLALEPAQGAAPGPAPVSEASPEHAPASDDFSPPPPAAATGAAPADPQQHPQPAPGYGYPQLPGRQLVGWGGQVPYNPYPHNNGAAPTQPYGAGSYLEPREPRRSRRSTALLVLVALVVALGAGGSVYALMKGGGNGSRTATGSGGRATSAAPTTPGSADGQPSPTGSASAAAKPSGDDAVPSGYLGTWDAAIDNSTGHNTRQLTITQGTVGDPVLKLVADGPGYHCVFSADLTRKPGGDGPLRIGASTVTSGQPLSSCSPGAASEVTLLSDGTLQRVNTDSGEKLTYTKSG
ncbi:serine/threonine-protein kinase [Streptomyces sp. NPDC091280]|uniref:serine/threonine-protein kinase n=1 Tax=Streptomyces sp. NPDC091280 TaxID=3365984 RepID=UPI003817D043